MGLSAISLTSHQNIIAHENPMIFDFGMGLSAISPTSDQNLITEERPDVVVSAIEFPSTSCTKNQNVILQGSQSSSSDIVSIFSKHLVEMQSSTTTAKNFRGIPSLKTARYGEVLTTEEVLERLREATLKKKQTKAGIGKKGEGLPKNKVSLILIKLRILLN